MDKTHLIADLTSSDPEVRDLAREELSLIMDDDIAQTLLDVATGDAGEEARADAVIALGPIIEEAGMDYFDESLEVDADLGPPISREMFTTMVQRVRALYDDESQPKLIRRRALEVLVRDPQPWMDGEIRKLVVSKDADWRRSAVFAMGYVGGFEKEIAALVESAEGDLLYEAVRAAGGQEVGSAARRIRQLAASEETDHDLRLVAIEALPRLDNECDELLEKLSASKNREIAETAEAMMDELLMFRGEGFDEED